MASVTAIPPAVLEWLTGSERTSVLLIGAGGNHAPLLARAGHVVTVADPDPTVLSLLAAHRSWIHVVAARGDALPFDPCCFSVVLAIQNFHTFAPGLALSEWARVLKPQGRIGLAYLTRDNSVPWVQKLRRIVQAYLPTAMTSDHGVESAAALDGSSYFRQLEKMSHRLWMPSTRSQLQSSARQAPGAEDLTAEQLEAMLEQIGQLYDEYARVPDPLQLPYQIQCWRARVDQTELTSSLIPGDDGLSISL